VLLLLKLTMSGVMATV